MDTMPVRELSPIQQAPEQSLLSSLSDCTLCPRSCHVNRLRGVRGFCGEAGTLRAARAALYYNEEPVISGSRGSGTIFFTGCNLGCIYCQNRSISRPVSSRTDAEPVSLTNPQKNPPASIQSDSRKNSSPCLTELSPERLSDIFFELEAQGAHNINLVTPEHFVPLLIPSLRRAKREGLSIPIVYNTGSYERVESIRALEGLVDVWLPDLKYVSSALSMCHTGAGDYFQYASAAIAEMVRQCPEPLFSDGSSSVDCPDDADDPLMLRGVLVRHLALPGCGEDSRAVLRHLHENYGNQIFISILNQYTPMPQVFTELSAKKERTTGESLQTPSLDSLSRRLTAEEYDSLVAYAIELGIENGFVQESGTVSPSYIPVFDGTGL